MKKVNLYTISQSYLLKEALSDLGYIPLFDKFNNSSNFFSLRGLGKVLDKEDNKLVNFLSKKVFNENSFNLFKNNLKNYMYSIHHLNDKEFKIKLLYKKLSLDDKVIDNITSSALNKTNDNKLSRFRDFMKSKTI